MRQQASNPWVIMLLCLVSSLVVALPVNCVNIKLEHNQGSYGFIQLFEEALSKETLRHVGPRGDVCDSRRRRSRSRVVGGTARCSRVWLEVVQLV